MATIYYPFDPSRITEGFGWAAWRNGVHDGIDFGIGQGTELRATASGVVRNNDGGTKDGAGIDITTDDGWIVRHWHISQFGVPNGSRVEAGQVIGRTGGAVGTWGAGWSTGPHIHWGVKVGGRWVDPAGLNPQRFGSAPSASIAGDVSALADAVLRGDFGNGPARQAALGARFAEVQAEVNRRLNGGAPAPAPAPVSSASNVVQPGDGYWHIAQRVWGGDNATIEANMQKLISLNGNKRLFAGDTVILEAPAPAPAPAPVPEVKPEPAKEEAKPQAAKPVVTPEPEKEILLPTMSKEEEAEYFKAQQALSSTIKPADLGNIITNNRARKVVWAAYGILGLVILAGMGGLQATNMLAPEWFMFTVGAYAALGPAFSSLAIANITTDKK